MTLEPMRQFDAELRGIADVLEAHVRAHPERAAFLNRWAAHFREDWRSFHLLLLREVDDDE